LTHARPRCALYQQETPPWLAHPDVLSLSSVLLRQSRSKFQWSISMPVSEHGPGCKRLCQWWSHWVTTAFRRVYKERPRAGAHISIALSFKEATMSRKSGRRPTGARRRRHARVQVINPNAAGIDLGSGLHVVAVPPDRDPAPVRSFGCFTAVSTPLPSGSSNVVLRRWPWNPLGCIGFPCIRSLNPMALRSS
jgi:hypothetical protein